MLAIAQPEAVQFRALSLGVLKQKGVETEREKYKTRGERRLGIYTTLSLPIWYGVNRLEGGSYVARTSRTSIK